MAKRTRTTHKKKVYNSDNHDLWIEVERLDKLIVENGRGASYQKVVYSFLWENEQDDGTWDGSKDRTTVKRIENPLDSSQYVELPIIDKVIVETGRGQRYRKSVWHFENSDKNKSRVTHKKTVHGSENPSDTLDVEVIDNIHHEFGRGALYQKTVSTYEDQGDEHGAGG